jgi:hypothetical protein
MSGMAELPSPYASRRTAVVTRKPPQMTRWFDGPQRVGYGRPRQAGWPTISLSNYQRERPIPRLFQMFEQTCAPSTRLRPSGNMTATYECCRQASRSGT